MPRKRERRGFGGHITTLREARGLSQEELAERCGLSPETIRRIEGIAAIPNPTLQQLADGLDLQLSTLIEAYEVGARDPARELTDLLVGRSDDEIRLVVGILRAVLRELDAAR